MKNIKSLKDQEFLATILDNKKTSNLDPKQQGRYRVHIPDLFPGIDDTKGIWVKNQSHKWHITNSKYGEYGQHFPLQPYTKVIVKFHEEDYNTGYIDRIISDYRPSTDVEGQDCTDKKPSLTDRDEQYILIKTPKFWNIIYINEETENEPNTIYLIYNRDKESKYTERSADVNRERRTVVRIDETGVHYWTHDNERKRIKQDKNMQVDSNLTDYIMGFDTKHVDGDQDLHIHSNQIYRIDENQDRTVDGNKTTLIKGNDEEHIIGKKLRLIDQQLDEIITGKITQMCENSREVHILNNDTLVVDGVYNLCVSGTLNISSTSPININSGTKVNINCASPNMVSPSTPDYPEDPEEPKPKTFVRDLGPNETVEYGEQDRVENERDVVVGKKCDDATKNYNIEYRETLENNQYDGD